MKLSLEELILVKFSLIHQVGHYQSLASFSKSLKLPEEAKSSARQARKAQKLLDRLEAFTKDVYQVEAKKTGQQEVFLENRPYKRK